MPVHGQMVIPIKARGGAPEYHRETRIYTPGSAGVPQISDAAGRLAVEGYRAENAANAGTAQALARLGGALDNAVKVGAKAYQDYQAALAQNAYNQYEADEIRLKAELNTLQGQNALGEDGVMARLGRWREEAREKYAGNLAPIARDLFHRNVRRLDAATDAWAIGKQDRENINFQNSVSEGSMKNAETLALNNPGNDEIFHQTLGVLRAEIEKIGARNGWDMSLVKAKFQEAAQKLQFSRVKSLIDSEDYNGAERVLGASGGASGAFAQNEATARRGRLADTAGMDGAVVSLIREIAPKYGMDPELMLAISKAESGGKVKAATSKAGAVGPMQLIPKWAKKAGFDPYDLRQNIEGGISEFAQLLKKYGNEKEALIAYNWGLGNWDTFKKTGKGYYGQPRPTENIKYVNAVYKHIGGRQATQGQTGPGPAVKTGGANYLSPGQYGVLMNQIEAGRKREMAELRVGLEMQLNDFRAAAKDGKADAIQIDPAIVRLAHGDKADRVIAEINEMSKLSDAVKQLENTDAEGIGKLLKDFEPDPSGEGYALKRKVREEYRQIAQAHLLERAKNPTGYLMNVNPDLQKAYNAMLQNPTQQTVNNYLQGLQSGADVLKLGDVPIFPAGQAQALSNAIMAQPNPGETLERLSNAFGQNWGRAFQELSAKDCLPVSAQVIGNGMDQTDAKLLMEGIKDKDFQDKFYDLHKNANFAKKDFETRLESEMTQFNSTLLAIGDQSTATELNRAVSILAMQYMNTQGLGYRDAIQKAAKNVILDRYSLQSVNGGKFRVPKAFYGDAVERGAGAALMEIAGNTDELLTAQYKHLGEHAATMFGNQIKRAGHWATNADESGLILFVGPNAVLDKKGQPVMRTWAELQKSAKSWQEQEREQNFDYALATGMEE